MEEIQSTLSIIPHPRLQRHPKAKERHAVFVTEERHTCWFCSLPSAGCRPCPAPPQPRALSPHGAAPSSSPTAKPPPQGLGLPTLRAARRDGTAPTSLSCGHQPRSWAAGSRCQPWPCPGPPSPSSPHKTPSRRHTGPALNNRMIS